LASDAQSAVDEAERLEGLVEQLRGALAECEAQRNIARDQLEEFDNQAAEQSALISKFDLEKARLENNEAMAQTRLSSIREEVVRHEAALAQAQERLSAAQKEFANNESALQAQGARGATNLEQRYEAATQAVSAASAKIEELRESIHTDERERDSLASKRSTLNLTLEQKDGASALASAGLKGIRGLLANHMTIEPGFEAAIAAALGSLADALVADSRDAGLGAIEHLKGTDQGRVELIIADVDAKQKPASSASQDGARGASEVVSAPAAVLDLLADVIVVDSLDVAQKFYRSDKSIEHKTLITLDGDVLTRSVLRGGSQSKPSKIELVAERDAAEAQLAKVSARIETSRAELAQARATEDAAKESAKQALAELNQHDAALASNAEQLGRLKVQVEAAENEVRRLAETLQTATASIATAESVVAEASAAVEAFAKSERPSVEAANRQPLVDALEKQRERELEVRVELGAAVERVRVESERAASLTQQVAEAQAAIERAKALADSQAKQLASAKKVLAVLPSVMDAVAEQSAAAKVKLTQLDAERQSQFSELVRLRGEVSDIQNKLSALTQSVHDIELGNHEKRLNLANLVAKAHDELGLEQSVLIAEFGPDQLIADENDPSHLMPFDREQQVSRLRNAERLLERLGRVNPLALEEFAALEQRHKFLTEQLADLTQTRKDLLQIIEDLDERMKSIFEDAFNDTRKAFEQVFPVLFPGGSGSIFLTDPEDLLTTGIEVTVKPAGKRIERLSLLSGGERSLAAVALLIAIFKARPSPFYVMDEVEAALDDANLGRLLQIFKDLRENSQLIIVTHQKRTMEIADALYGVSMRQDGVSAVVGQRLEKAS
jgi:chromosome segregation protein